MTDTTACGHRPFKNSTAYGDWTCQRRRWHLGRHRYRNYTTPRIPRLWRVLHRPVSLARKAWRLHRIGKINGAVANALRRRVRPTRYDPEHYR